MQKSMKKGTGRKSLGLLVDPSKTFKVVIGSRVAQLQYDKLQQEFKDQKQFFLDFLGGNFQEINTLTSELSSVANVSILLYINENCFISDDSKISPWELTHPKAGGTNLDLKNWVNKKDILIISLTTDKLKEFLDSHFDKIVRTNKPCIVSTGKKMIRELTKQLPENFTFLERKGVARFGYDNRKQILELVRGFP